MSLIYDALRKSEEQRRAGEVPTLASGPAWQPPRKAPSPLPKILIGLLALAAIGLWAFSPDGSEDEVEAVATTEAGEEADQGGATTRDRSDDRRSASSTRARGEGEAGSNRPSTTRRERQRVATATHDEYGRAIPQPGSSGMPILPTESPTPSTVPTMDAGQMALAQSAQANQSVPPPPAAPRPTPANPKAAPGTPADLEARAGVSPQMQDKFDRGEVFANSPQQLAEPKPTSPGYVPPEAALPQPLAEAAPAVPPAPSAAAPAPAPAAAASAATASAPPASTATAAETPVATAAPATDPASAAVPAPAAPAPAPFTTDPALPAVPLIYELSLATRKALPALKLNMLVFNQDPARRFAIIDGTRAGEGQPLANELNVESIRPDGVVLVYRGERFLLPRAGL